ncbi:MAG: phosphate ABC transporter permease PstA, partial [Candidatus Rokuibacteriota bacterium]
MRGFWKSGEPYIWLTGAALAGALLMVAGLVLLVLVNGMGSFWPRDVVRLTLADGQTVMGEVVEREAIPEPGAPADTPRRYRVKVEQGNRDLYGADFVWMEEAAIAGRETPAEAVVIERREWGNLYGVLLEVRDRGAIVARGPAAAAA